MRHLKTYEGLFDFLKTKKKEVKNTPKSNQEDIEVDDRKMSDKRKNQISEVIAECLQDIFDEYNVTKYTNDLVSIINIDEDDLNKYWTFMCNTDRNVKEGIKIYNIGSWDSIENEIYKKIKFMEELTGVNLDIEMFDNYDNDSMDIEITFPFYVQKFHREYVKKLHRR